MTGQREILILQAYQVTIKALLDHFYLQNQVMSPTAAACQAHCRATLQPLSLFSQRREDSIFSKIRAKTKRLRAEKCLKHCILISGKASRDFSFILFFFFMLVNNLHQMTLYPGVLTKGEENLHDTEALLPTLALQLTPLFFSLSFSTKSHEIKMVSSMY